jgi:hypothetical protein
MIDRASNRKVAQSIKAKAQRTKALYDEVLSLVHASNEAALPERHVTPRAALIVMSRAMNELSSLSDDSRRHGVLREVTKFISLNQKTLLASVSMKHADLLPKGHPLSPLNASLTEEDFRKKYAEWIAADPSIADEARPLVAMAHSLAPESIKREHAFMRLRALAASTVPAYFKIDDVTALIAAFSAGNSSAARRARVALQWRDRFGRWVEMGRGVNFRFRLADGSIQVGRGNYVGAGGDTRVENSAEGPTLVSDSGLIEVSGVPGLNPGLYVVNSSNAAVYKARIPGFAAPQEPSFKDQFDEAVPNVADLTATRRALPIGWKKQGPFYVSDDNYAVLPRNGQPYSVLRLDENGRPTGDAVARVRDWAEVNAAIEKDQPEFDKEIARLESDKLPIGRIPGATAEDVISADDILKMQEKRAQENKSFDELQPAAEELGDKDLNGNAVPESWTRDADNDKGYTREMPLRDGGTYPLLARVLDDGKYIAGHSSAWISGDSGGTRMFESWKEIESSIPEFVEYLNDTFTKDNPIVQKRPSAPSSIGKGAPIKVPSLSNPGAPELFKDFNAPSGAFQLRTTEYEPEGRVDEKSNDFTDDPRRLATKFSLTELVTAFTEALIGRPDDNAMEDILDANVDDNGDLPDLTDLADVAELDAPRARANNASGAGVLEFSAGEEYVSAEALYSAVYEAGGDPNRVIANAYDAVNGNRNNAQKLLDAQGGVSSSDDIQLIEDITDEIRQISDAAPDDETPAYKRNKPEEDLGGKLIENVPVDYDNPDYFDMDTDSYIPSVSDLDENGYTDNPVILATDYETADLIDQMLEGITDGSGVALLDFGGESGPTEVPIEALRDALQIQGVNTNEILFNLRDESNDMSEDKPKPEATVEETPEAPEAPAVEESNFAPFADALEGEEDTVSSEQVERLDSSANTLVDFFSNGLGGARILAFNAEGGFIAVRTRRTDLEESQIILVSASGNVQSTIINDETWFAEGGADLGWEPVPQEVVDAIYQENGRRFPGTAETPTIPGEPAAAPEEPTPVSPAFAYPGPREAGYSVNNTTLASDGSVVGAGSIVTANRDGKRGTVVSIQNDPEYARIRFDDGKIAVRSANQIKAVSNPDGTLAVAPSGNVTPTPSAPATDVEARLDAPIGNAPIIARSGVAWGINDASSTPDFLQGNVQENIAQSDFSAWGDRDAEIAKAASTRATLDYLIKAARDVITQREAGDAQKGIDAQKLVRQILSDTFGQRDGLSFGADSYEVRVISANSYTRDSTEDLNAGRGTYTFNVGFELIDKSGGRVGEGSRRLDVKLGFDENGNPTKETSVKNEILKVFGNKKKKGFASAYNRYMENWYIANGIDKVKVYAAGGGSWQGAFVWALNGFDWDPNSNGAQAISRAISSQARTPEERALAAKLTQKMIDAGGDPSRTPTPLEMALIGWYPGADNWLGKRVIIERSWEGVKHLTPNAKEQKQAINYNQIKNAERRIKAGQNKPNMGANALAQVMDNEFQTSNPELAPHIEQIRDALRNNRPLGFLSPVAKSALSRFISKEMLDKDSKMPMEDLFRLRTALASEYRAENDFANPFAGIADGLADFSLDDFMTNSETLNAAGFKSESLSAAESGMNSTFRVVHKPSGQIFFVKEEELSRRWNGVRGLTNEVEINTLMNALEMYGIPSIRGSRENRDVIIMSQAGATLSLLAPPINASTMLSKGILGADGQIIEGDDGEFVDVLKNPEDILNMAIIDMIGVNQDRHDGNWMVAIDNLDGRMLMFPIDNALAQTDKESDGIEDFLSFGWQDAGEVYQDAIPRLLELAGEERTKQMFLNQVSKLVTNLDNPLFQSKGEELAALISKWGSYDAFKDAMKARLTKIITPGTDESKALDRAMKKSYWR